MDCLDCGACCKVFGIIETYPSDNIDQALIESTELGYNRMKTVGFRCICLQPDNKCSIYVTRPTVCKKLTKNGSLCKMAIEQLQRIQ